MTAGAQNARSPSPILRPPLRSVSQTTAETEVWRALRAEAEAALIEEPLYAGIIQATVLDQPSLVHAFAYRLAHRLGDGDLARLSTRDLCLSAFEADPHAGATRCATSSPSASATPPAAATSTRFLFYKGLAALEGYRVGHWLWHQGRATLALHIQSRISEVFGADIHPAARIGSASSSTTPPRRDRRDHGDRRRRLDPAIGDARGNGKDSGDRHPKIARGVLLSVGAKVLGNIRVGEGAKVAAAAVVLHDVPAHTTVAGVPARVVSRIHTAEDPAQSMDQFFGDGI